jgi:predicted dehydrogenase
METIEALSEPEVLTSANPIRLGLLGLNFGAGIARQIAGVPCFDLRAVCDSDSEKSQRIGQELGVKAYQQFDAMLEDPEIEAIGLFTGPSGRAKLISRIIESNRHVLTTKPFELDASEADRVLDQAKERGLIIQLNSPGPRPAEDLRAIQNLVRDHDLGRPVGFRAETWTRYQEKANGTWYDDPQACSVAPILRLGIYFLNEFASLFGKPSEVHVMQSRIFTERPTSDHAQMSIAYENGALGFVFASFCIEDGQPFRDHITLNYQRGTIRRWVERNDPEKDLSGDTAVVELQKKGLPPVRIRTTPGAFAGWYQWDAFWNAIRGGLPMTDEEVRNVKFGVNLLDAMRVSATTGKPAPVRPLPA